MNDHDMSPDKRRRLNELDAAIAAQDEEYDRRALEHAGITQLGLARVELLRLGVLDDPDEFAERAKGNWLVNEKTGQVIAWWLIDGERAYYRKDGLVYVERAGHGALEWSVLGLDGEPLEPWQRTVPPFGRWALN